MYFHFMSLEIIKAHSKIFMYLNNQMLNDKIIKNT